MISIVHEATYVPLQNRVRPDGEIVAVASRGTMMGNRGGAFHTAEQVLLPRHWHSRQWICCVLDFNGRRRQVMQPRRYTELFFLDEATALAAGHRPCFECRRAAADHFAHCWNAVRKLRGRARAAQMDRALHAERTDRQGRKRSHVASLDALPDHSLIRHGAGFARVGGGHLQIWTFDGYGALEDRPQGHHVEVLTPPSIVAVLGAGFVPMLHKSAAT